MKLKAYVKVIKIMNSNSEPLLVGTNTTLNYDASTDNNLSYDTENQPLAVGTNLTIDITYAEAELLKQQLGISLDGSDNYLGSNISIIDGDRNWLERIDNNPLYSEDSQQGGASDSYTWDLPEADSETTEAEAAEVDFSSYSSEPLLVGSNITFVVKEDADGNSDLSQNPSLSQRDETTPFALGTNMLLDLPSEEQQDSYLGTNLSTIGGDSSAMQGGSFGGDSSAMQGSSMGGGMIPAEFGNSTENDNENDDYAWDFNGQLDRFSTNDSEGTGSNIDPDALFAASPWGSLTETGAVDGFEDVFPNGAGEIENNPFAGGFGGGE